MIQSILNLLKAVFGSLKSRNQLVLENLLLRQRLLVVRRAAPKPKFKSYNRLLFTGLSRTYRNWKDALIIVKPETVIKWHKTGFRLFWKWKSRNRTGRRRKDAEIRNLIRSM